MGKTGIIIANTGSPNAPTPEAMREYLNEFLTDPRIRPMNPIIWNLILKGFILPKRSVASAQKYAQIWMPKGSPLSVYMRSLAQKLSDYLNASRKSERSAKMENTRETENFQKNGTDTQVIDRTDEEDRGFIVRHAMSYGTPSIHEALVGLHDAGCNKIITIPLYPQSAFSTSKVIEDKLNAEFNSIRSESRLPSKGQLPKVEFVDEYCEENEYLSAIADSIRNSGFGERMRDSLLIAFHSIPMKDVAAGDTYEKQVHSTARSLARMLDITDDHWQIGFQCRFDKSRKWVGPSTTQAMDELIENGGRLFVVAPNFSIDCLETLHDIDVVLRERFYARTNNTSTPIPSSSSTANSKPSNLSASNSDISSLTATNYDAESSRALMQDFCYINCLNDSDAHVRLLASLIEERF